MDASSPDSEPSAVPVRTPRHTPFNPAPFNEDGPPRGNVDQELRPRSWDMDMSTAMQERGNVVSSSADRPKEEAVNRTFNRTVPPSLRPEHEDLWTKAQGIWTPATKHDVTLRLEMGIADDLENRLEEFSRLKRLGHFHSAEQYYQDWLEIFSDEYPIAIEYADMLAGQGAWERLDQFIMAKEPLLTATEAPDRGYATEWYMRRTTLQLIAALSGIHTHSRLKEAYDQVTSVEAGLQKQGRSAMLLESSGIQVARYALVILSIVEFETDLIPEHRFDVWSNCYSMYKTLVVQDRIWDARDLIVALLDADGPDAWKWIFKTDIYSPDAFSQVLLDWNVQQYDASTYLAVLDMLVDLARALGPFTNSNLDEERHAAERCLQHACSIATCLKENDLQLVKSRPYMRWVLKERELHLSRERAADNALKRHLDKFPGIKFWQGYVPIYLPITSENPGWCNTPAPTEYSPGPMLESTLQAARELGDYETEAACLWEMIYNASTAPIEQFSQLSKLQKVTQGDMLEYRVNCLSRYLIAQTDAARRELLDELAMIRARRKTSFEYSLSDWFEVVIEQALGVSSSMSVSRELDRREQFSRYIPQYCKDELLGSGLDKLYGLNLESTIP